MDDERAFVSRIRRGTGRASDSCKEGPVTVRSPGRRQLEKDQRRRSILEAARALLLKKGYDAVSIRQIAAISELGAGTIYSYFSGKPEIYATLSTEVFDLLHDCFSRAAAAGGSPDEKLRAVGAAMLKFSEEHRSYYDFIDYFLSSPGTIFPPEMKARIDAYGARVLSPVIKVIDEGLGGGQFETADSARSALLFLGMLHGVIHFRKLRGTLLSESGFEEMYRQGVEAMVASLRAGGVKPVD